jgi:hypothetical protein
VEARWRLEKRPVCKRGPFFVCTGRRHRPVTPNLHAGGPCLRLVIPSPCSGQALSAAKDLRAQHGNRPSFHPWAGCFTPFSMTNRRCSPYKIQSHTDSWARQIAIAFPDSRRYSTVVCVKRYAARRTCPPGWGPGPAARSLGALYRMALHRGAGHGGS